MGYSFSRLTWFERLLSLVTSVRPGEGRSVLALLAQVYLLLLGYYLLRPVREVLILSEGTPEIRAYATGAVAVTLIFLIPLYKLLFDQVGGNGSKSAMLRWVTAFFVSNLVIFAFLIWLGIPVAVPFYIWVGLFSVMVVAQFWAFAADLFNIKTGQRLFTVIMVGAALGAWSGSQIAGRLFALLGAANLLLLSAALLVCVMTLGYYTERSVPTGSRSTSPKQPADARAGSLGEILGGFHVVARSRYLLLIAIFVMLLNWINSTGTYILATFITQYAAEVVTTGFGAITSEDVFARVYGNYFAWITAVQLFLQLFLVSRLFRWFGIRGVILVLPLVMIANYGLIAMVPVFALVRLMMIIESSVNYSVHNTANHALYLPVSREEKYLGKTTIDTFFWRFGDLIHAMMILVMAQILGLEVWWIIAINLGLALILLTIGTAIGRHHKREIRQNLTNLPPEVSAPLPDVYVPTGQVLMFSVPDRAFMDPDPGDTLSYRACQADGNPLPTWVRFDRFNQTFSVKPPDQTSGQVDVVLVATDFEGLSVRSGFSIRYGPESLPRFTTAAESSAPD